MNNENKSHEEILGKYLAWFDIGLDGNRKLCYYDDALSAMAEVAGLRDVKIKDLNDAIIFEHEQNDILRKEIEELKAEISSLQRHLPYK